MTAVAPDRIRISGTVHVGDEVELRQRIERPASAASFFTTGRPIGMPAVEHTTQMRAAGELPMDRLAYSLVPSEGDVYIENDGLVASYGIFGAPGSGKTHLLLYLLRQILALNIDAPDLKYGGLILDPKAALIGDVRRIVEEAGRSEDLIVLNTDEMIANGAAVNVIDSGLDPYELGQQLVLAAQSAGVSTSDPYWILAWGNLFGAAMYVLAHQPGGNVVTLRDLLDAVLGSDADASLLDGASERRIQSIARQARATLDDLPELQRQDMLQAINQVETFFRQENENVATIEAIVTRAYSPFQRSRFNCYSEVQSRAVSSRNPNFYDRMIDEGRLVLVSLSPAEPAVAKILCTLVKCLFQRSVLGRLERVRAGRLENFRRPLILACDEYSQIASEVQGQPMGDGDFFSQARQNGCMGLLATQSVNVLQASSLKENWRSVFSNMGAKIFMRLVDNETAEEASKLAGESDWYVSSRGTSRSKDGLGSSSQTDLKDRKSLPTSVLTQVFRRGDGAVIGSLDGSADGSFLRFIHVPAR
jgi:TraM recognition site of TraD and TraG